MSVADVRPSLVVLVTLVVVMIGTLACGDGGSISPTQPTPTPSTTPTRTGITCGSVAVVDGVVTLDVGETVTVNCQVEYSDNTIADLPASATWESGDTSIATVTPGEVTGVAPGDTEIVVRLDTATARFAVRVEAPPAPSRLTEYRIIGFVGHNQQRLSLEVGQKEDVWGRATYSDGTEETVVSDATWALSNNRVATIAIGRYATISAHRPGVANLRSTFMGRTARVRVEVKPKPKPWRRSGTGATVLDLPVRITTIRIEGEYDGRSQNFIVWCGSSGNLGGLLVNEILGTSSIADGRRYSGVHSARRSYNSPGAPCGRLQIELSRGVRWTITEVAPRSGLSFAVNTGSESADRAAVERTRSQVLRANAR